MIKSEEYPLLVDFMRKSLFQYAAPTFEDAIGLWKKTGKTSVQQVVDEIDIFLSKSYSEQEAIDFVARYSEYIEESGGVATLKRIKDILESFE